MLKLREKVDKAYKIKDSNEYDHDVLNYIYSRRHVKSTKNVMMHNKPKTYLELFNVLKRLQAIGPAFTLEKMIICYGETKGKTLYDKRMEKYGITLEKMIERYGVESGTERFNEYRKKQAFSNTYEYKHKKYGMSKEDFKAYNKGRAVTLKNMIKKYGTEEGTKRFNLYREKQAYTNSKEYLGEAKYYEVNKKKKLSLENFIRKYGEKEGNAKYKKYIKQALSGYSLISQRLFKELIDRQIIKGEVYYAELNYEYAVINEETGSFYKYDFISIDNNICIEFNGDHYHGNPKIYRPDDYLKGRGCRNIKAKEKWESDEKKINALKLEKGIDTIVVWESDYKNDPEQVIKRISDYVRCNV